MSRHAAELSTGPTTGSSDAAPAPARRTSGELMRSPVVRLLPVVLAAVVVFLVHFRPWQGGLLEEWGLALAWDSEGFGGLWTRMPGMLGRPLHLVPHYLGMVLSDGGLVGPYAVLGVVAVGQLAAAAWALRSLTASRLLRWSVAVAIALHPWWPAGELLRFLPAQVATLGVILWFGAAARHLADGRRRWYLLMVAAPLAGLLTYQAPAATLVGGAVVLAGTSAAPWRRRLVVTGLAVAVSGAVMAWSALIVPHLAPESYESQLIGADIDLATSVRTIVRTLALHAPVLIVAMAAVGSLVISLGFRQRLSSGPAWLLLLGTAGAPLAALTYASQSAHLNDPERVSTPVGLMLWLVLACALGALGTERGTAHAVALVLVVVSMAGSVAGYTTWTRFAAEQQSLLAAVEPVRADAPADGQLVAADTTGRFGDIYLLMPPYLDIALIEEFGPGASVVLCTPDDVVREQPRAALYPLVPTPSCGTLLVPGQSSPVATVETELGSLTLYDASAGG